jgi:trehalose/maltose hydrolase-like predicted phosphorylase
MDVATGELTSRFGFAAGDSTAHAEVVTFASRTDLALVLQELTVRCDRDADVILSAGIATTDVPGRWLDADAIPSGEPPTADAWLAWEGRAGAARCGLVIATVGDEAEGDPGVEVQEVRRLVSVSHRFRVRAGRPVRIRSIAGLVADLAHPRPHRQAALLVARGLARGWNGLREANRRAWSELWRARPLIDAPGDWQRLADASFYYLHSSASSASTASTGVFGLAYAPEYHYYRGHVMWDIESFAFPPLVLTDPAAARAILRFRSRTTRAARANAALHGYAGLQYPWEADFETGAEAVPRWSKTDKDHVTLDVGLAFELYASATGDPLFSRLEALPVVAGVAEWLMSRVEPTERGLEIRRVRGPAEAFEPVDNDAFVNLAAITFLRRAAELVGELGDIHPGSGRRPPTRSWCLEIVAPGRFSTTMDSVRTSRSARRRRRPPPSSRSVTGTALRSRRPPCATRSDTRCPATSARRCCPRRLASMPRGWVDESSRPSCSIADTRRSSTTRSMHPTSTRPRTSGSHRRARCSPTSAHS